MAFSLSSRLFKSVSVLFFAALIIFSFSPEASAIPEIIVTVGDTTGLPNGLNSVISIYMDNFIDTIAGFNLWIQLDRPDLIKFQINAGTTIDTTYWICNEYDGGNCIDSSATIPIGAWDFENIDTSIIQIGNHDTTGTMISGWEYVDSRSLSGLGSDINISAFADYPPPPTTAGIAPQQGGLLIKILADIFDIPNTELERTVHLLIQHDIVNKFNMSRTDGSSIGISYAPYIDTSCYVCDVPCGPGLCCGYEKVSPPGGDYDNCDSTFIIPDSTPYVDETIVLLIDGSLTVEIPPEYVCGQINGDGSEFANIADLTYLVRYIFKGGSAPDPILGADLNCSGTTNPVDIADLTYLVRYLFKGGTAPCADCN